jgi:hypothetical protein
VDVQIHLARDGGFGIRDGAGVVTAVVVEDEIDGMDSSREEEALADFNSGEPGALEGDPGLLGRVGERDDPAALRRCRRRDGCAEETDDDQGGAQRRKETASKPAFERELRPRNPGLGLGGSIEGGRRGPPRLFSGWRR